MLVRRGCMAEALYIAVGFAALSGTAHAQLFYNSKLDARAKAALAQYEESKKAHLALLDARIADIGRQESALVDAAVRTNLAERDAAIAEVLGEDERAGAPARLRGITVSRINAIVPGTFDERLASTDQLRAVSNVLETIGSSRVDPLSVPTQRRAHRVDMIKSQFGKAKRKPTHGAKDPPSQDDWTVGWYCRFVVLPFRKSGGSDVQFMNQVLVGEAGLPAEEAERAAGHSYNYCKEIAEPLIPPELPEGFQSDQAKFAMMALAGWKKDGSGIKLDAGEAAIRPALRLGLRIREVADETAALKKELAEAEAKAKRLKEERDKLVKLLGSNEIEAQLQVVTCFVLHVVGDDSCPPEVAQEMPKALGSLGEVREELLKLTALGPELDRLKQEAVFDIIRHLGDPSALHALAAAGCKPGENPPDDPEKRAALGRVCVTDAVMRGLGLIDQAGKIRQGIPGKVAELAVTLADAELHAATVRQRAAALADRAANLDGQRRALIAELQSLMLAYDDANSPAATSGRIDRGIVRLAQSVETGRANEERLTVRYGFIGQREFAQRERAIAAARYAMSDALLATMQASAAGGIKPEAVAQILGGLGLGANGIAEVVK